MPGFFKKRKPPVRVSAVIVAAGAATRMGGVDKQQLMLGDLPVVVRSVAQYSECERVAEIVVVCRHEEIATYLHMMQDYGLTKVTGVVSGGAQRQDSVFAGVGACMPGVDFYAIHDGARPFITVDLIDECIDSAIMYGAAAVGVAVKDTIKIVDSGGFIISTPDRSGLVAMQTPQIFGVQAYRAAMEKAIRSGRYYTDDCQLIEQSGGKVYISRGSYDNIKITTPEDIAAAQAVLAVREGFII